MSKKRYVVTTTKKPERICPECFEQVIKVVRMGQLSYECNKHWGPWDEAIKKALVV